jgi:hypothetical protein
VRVLISAKTGKELQHSSRVIHKCGYLYNAIYINILGIDSWRYNKEISTYWLLRIRSRSETARNKGMPSELSTMGTGFRIVYPRIVHEGDVDNTTVRDGGARFFWRLFEFSCGGEEFVSEITEERVEFGVSGPEAVNRRG